MSRALFSGLLASAAIMTAAGAADAAIATLTMQGAYGVATAPAGSFDGINFGNPITHNGATDTILYQQGGFGWTTTLTYDTSLGVLTTNNGVQTLTWNAAMGTPSPLLAGGYMGLGGGRGLTDATSVFLQFSSSGPSYGLIGPGYSLSDQWASFDGPFSGDLTTPFSDFSGQALDFGGYHSGQFSGTESYLWTASIVPNVAVVPEPAAWTLAIAGFGAMGALIRARRRHAAA